MAMFHCSIKIISRASGRSGVASAAYRSGEKLYNDETGITHDFTKKGGVVFSEICIPDNAPREFNNREYFWNEVQKVEKRADAQLAREIEVALPKEFTREQQIETVSIYIQENFVSKGMCADWALHDKGDRNPHAHIMLTVRAFDEKGKWVAKQKTSFAFDEEGMKIPIIDEATGEQRVRIREGKGAEKLWLRISVPSNDWNDHSKAEEWREAWATVCNKLLPANKQIDHRSYEKQGIDKIATIHEGVAARDIEKNGGISNKCELNREIKKYNSIYENAKALALEFTQSIIERARSIINGFNEFRRGNSDIGNTRKYADNLRTTTDRNRTVADDELTLEKITRGNVTVRENIGQRKSDTTIAEQKINRTESDIKNTNRIIEEFTRMIRSKEHEKNERVRQLLERRKHTQYRGTPDGERGASPTDTEALIREIRATTDSARATVDASRNERENRELEQQRLAINRSGAEVKGKQTETSRSSKARKSNAKSRYKQKTIL